MTPFTEEQLRRITEDGPGHPCSLQEMAVARQCLDAMARNSAALARAEAAEALLREFMEWPLVVKKGKGLRDRIRAHLATVPQRTLKGGDAPSASLSKEPANPHPAPYSPAPEASVSGAREAMTVAEIINAAILTEADLVRLANRAPSPYAFDPEARLARVCVALIEDNRRIGEERDSARQEIVALRSKLHEATHG